MKSFVNEYSRMNKLQNDVELLNAESEALTVKIEKEKIARRF